MQGHEFSLEDLFHLVIWWPYRMVIGLGTYCFKINCLSGRSWKMVGKMPETVWLRGSWRLVHLMGISQANPAAEPSFVPALIFFLKGSWAGVWNIAQTGRELNWCKACQIHFSFFILGSQNFISLKCSKCLGMSSQAVQRSFWKQRHLAGICPPF